MVGGHRGCTGLSPTGREQAGRLAERLHRTGELAGAAALYASVLPRAVETAEAIAGAVGGPPLATDCDLCEQHPGDADGMTWAEAEAAYGPSPSPGDPHRPLFPGGEAWADMVERVASRLAKMAAEHPGQLTVVACHGGVVRASLVAFLAPAEMDVLGLDSPENTSLTEWVHAPGAGWRLVRYNDFAHLLGAS